MGEDTSLRIFLSRVSTVEVLNKGLEGSVVEANNSWRKRERG